MLSLIYYVENAPKLSHPTVLTFVVSRMAWAESWVSEHVARVDSEFLAVVVGFVLNLTVQEISGTLKVLRHARNCVYLQQERMLPH